MFGRSIGNWRDVSSYWPSLGMLVMTAEPPRAFHHSVGILVTIPSLGGERRLPEMWATPLVRQNFHEPRKGGGLI